MERTRGKVAAAGLGKLGGSWQSHICMLINLENNWGVRQTTKPRVPVQEKKVSKPLVVKICGGCSGRNSQRHRRVCWRDPQGPKTHTNPPTREPAPERLDLLMGSGGSD